MRIEFVVSSFADQWSVRRGHTRALRYETWENAVRAAENLARAAAETGDHAVVKLVRDGVPESRVFAPARKRSVDVALAERWPAEAPGARVGRAED
jgi:hypothetical protein